MCKPSIGQLGVVEWFGLNFTWILLENSWFSLNFTSHTCVHARKCRISYLNFLEFCHGILSQISSWRGGPSRSNSLCKNLKKWEKNPRKSCFLSFFVKNGEIFYLNFQVKIADFLWIFIKNGLISGKYWLNSAIFSQFSSKMG